MSIDDGKVGVDQLFVGLTRPSLFLGVSQSFAMLNGLVCILVFIYTSDIKVFIVLAAIHTLGYILCFKEPLIIELFLMKMQKCNKCPNKSYHGTNSYDPY